MDIMLFTEEIWVNPPLSTFKKGGAKIKIKIKIHLIYFLQFHKKSRVKNLIQFGYTFFKGILKVWLHLFKRWIYIFKKNNLITN
jgi:hypothetical protein